VVKWAKFLAADPEARVRFRRYQIFCVVVFFNGVQSASWVQLREELLERNNSGSGLENREHGRKDPSRWPCGTLYPQMLALTTPTSGSRSIGIVRSRTQATEFVLFSLYSVLWSDLTNSVLALYANHQTIPKEYANIQRNHTYRTWCSGYIPVSKASPNQHRLFNNTAYLIVNVLELEEVVKRKELDHAGVRLALWLQPTACCTIQRYCPSALQRAQ
jgi:hypothetical protein